VLFLQKPQIILTKVGNIIAIEMGGDLGYHFGVFYCYQQDMLMYRFSVKNKRVPVFYRNYFFIGLNSV